MASFEPVSHHVHDFGRNSYLEVARRRLKDEEGESEFLVVSRGFYAADGTRRWTKFVTIPDDPDVRAWLADALKAA